MKKLFELLAWPLGFILLIAGFNLLYQTTFGGIALIIASLFVFPFARYFIAKRTNFKLHFWLKAAAVIGLLYIADAFQTKDFLQPRFEENKAEIIQSIETDIAKKDYSAALATLKTHRAVESEQVTTLRSQVDAALAEIKETQAAEDRENAKPAPKSRSSKIEIQFSTWDGSHRNLEQYIKSIMNDPDSYEHDKTIYSDEGDHLIVITSYRGKNAFGGIVRQAIKAKVSLEGQVLEIKNN